MKTNLILYELANADGKVFSPFAWRSRLALLQLGLPFESRPVLFTEIPDIEDGSYKTVPVLKDSGTIISDSWAIADHLQGAGHSEKQLFATPDARRHAGFVSAWYSAAVIGLIFRVILADIHASLDPRDQEYFRSTREKRMGMPLEQICPDPEPLLVKISRAMAPMRQQLKSASFLGGDQPDYADFIPFSGFIWAALSSNIKLLADDDTLQPWLDRCYTWLDSKHR